MKRLNIEIEETQLDQLNAILSHGIRSLVMRNLIRAFIKEAILRGMQGSSTEFVSAIVKGNFNITTD